MLDSLVEDVTIREDGFKLGLPFLSNWNMLGDKEDPTSKIGDDAQLYLNFDNVLRR